MDNSSADREHHETLAQTRQNDGGPEAEYSTNQINKNPQPARQHDLSQVAKQDRLIDETNPQDFWTH